VIERKESMGCHVCEVGWDWGLVEGTQALTLGHGRPWVGGGGEESGVGGWGWRVGVGRVGQEVTWHPAGAGVALGATLVKWEV
jgi:hypothetical protein